MTHTMKQPDEIKKSIEALKICHDLITFNPATGEDIDPIFLNKENRELYDGIDVVLQYIQQLKAERDAAGEVLDELKARNLCNSCKHSEGERLFLPGEYGCSSIYCAYEPRGVQKEEEQ